MPTNVKDPRSIVTPDAFEVSGAMLGLPLARPARRLGALLVDLALIGILTALLTDVQLVLWGTVALILLYAAARRPTQQGMGPHAAMLLRVSLGCLGAGILSIVLVVAAVVGLGDDEAGPVAISIGEGDVAGLVTEVVGSSARMADAAEALEEAETEAEAERAAGEILAILPEVGLSRQDRLGLLREMTPEDADWRARADDIYRRALDAAAGGDVAEAEAEREAGAQGDSTEGSGSATATPVDSLGLEEALQEYAALVAGGRAGQGEADAGRAEALRRRLVPELGGDTLGALERQLEDAREERNDLEEEVERLGDEGGGLVALLRDVWEQLGSAIGLWSLYFTVMLTLWKGQTVGKRLFGIRVVRLDGEPLNWWSSFERVGGYAAGLATGLLGFAQIFWDANRQCVHDKIVGTVVVMAGAEAVPGSWVGARVASDDQDGIPPREED